MPTSYQPSSVDLRRAQQVRLLHELRWAERSPYAARQIGRLAADLTPDQAFEALSVCGFSDKHSYMKAMDSGEVLVPGVPIVREYWTSGTSGKGREHVALGPVEERSFLFTHVLQMREAGLGRSDRLGLTWPSGPQAGGVVLRESAEMLGIIPLELGSLDTEQKAEYILRAGVTAVVGSALYLRRLLDVGGTELADALQVFLIAGEHYPIEWAETVADLGIGVYEWYGSTQTGAFATSCRRGVATPEGRGAMHIPPHLFAAEVLGPDGEQVAEGQRGELVITGFGRYATPLIRYRSADEVRWLGWAPCPECGRNWPSIECGTIERIDDMVRIRGVNVWPSAVESVLGRWTDVLDYRARVHLDERGNECAELSLEMVSGATPPPSFAEQVSEVVRREVGVRFEVIVLDGAVQTAEFKQRRLSDERYQ